MPKATPTGVLLGLLCVNIGLLCTAALQVCSFIDMNTDNHEAVCWQRLMSTSVGMLWDRDLLYKGEKQDAPFGVRVALLGISHGELDR